MQPDVMLSKIERSQLTVDEDGQNMSLFWKPDGSLIVILVFDELALLLGNGLMLNLNP